jgi:hypothetical protein
MERFRNIYTGGRRSDSILNKTNRCELLSINSVKPLSQPWYQRPPKDRVRQSSGTKPATGAAY